ncbi:MAG: GWxTD domain-containing protein [Bacteroidota bacterium]
MNLRLVVTFLFVVFPAVLSAQDDEYLALINRALIPQSYFDNLIIPPVDGEDAQVAIIFRMDNNFVPFQKLNIDDEIMAPNGEEFYSIVRLNSEIFEGKFERGRNRNIPNEPASRDAWSDTLFAASFEETKSSKKYTPGKLVTSLKPGTYNYVLQLSLLENTNERRSQRQNIVIPDFEEKRTGEVYLVKSVQNDVLTLTNMGERVRFGEDFYALIRIPEYEEDASYEVVINRAQTRRKDTLDIGQIKTVSVDAENIFTNSSLSITDDTEPALRLHKDKGTYTYALVSIPHSELESSIYRLRLSRVGDERPLARRLFRSYWQDMPASLLSLKVAQNMLRFIIPKDQIKALRQGNTSEQEQKFRQFWKAKDPTPTTVYNELMAEYYRRIDYAFKEFGTRQNLYGFDSDQGEIYIKYGPPDSRERLFPTSGTVREIWAYGNREFVFERGSGFGDFILLGKQSD